MSADASGVATWGGKNESGAGCASGVSFALAGSGSSRATLKVAILR